MVNVINIWNCYLIASSYVIIYSVYIATRKHNLYMNMEN